MAPQECIAAEVAQSGNNRPVYILGESFGGLVCLALAAQCPDLVDRVILVNPATSFGSSVWPAAGPLLTALPDQVYNLLPFALSPLITNPIALAMHAVDTKKSPVEQVGVRNHRHRLIALLPRPASALLRQLTAGAGDVRAAMPHTLLFSPWQE